MNNLQPRTYTESNDRAENSFLLNLIEADNEESVNETKPHSHNMYILSFLYEGTIPHYADFERKPVQAPALLILNPDQIHIHTSTKGCKIYSLIFSPDFIHGESKELYAFLQSLFSQYTVQLTDQELSEIDTYIQHLRIECEDKNKGDFMIIKMLVNIIVIYCSKIVNRFIGPVNGKSELYYRFLILLRKKLDKYHQVTEYARDLNVSTDVLNQIVKDRTGKSPKQMIDEQLLLEAKRALYWSEATVKEIGWTLGFETDSYFIRFFKKSTGITPKQYRDASAFNRQ